MADDVIVESSGFLHSWRAPGPNGGLVPVHFGVYSQNSRSVPHRSTVRIHRKYGMPPLWVVLFAQHCHGIVNPILFIRLLAVLRHGTNRVRRRISRPSIVNFFCQPSAWLALGFDWSSTLWLRSAGSTPSPFDPRSTIWNDRPVLRDPRLPLARWPRACCSPPPNPAVMTRPQRSPSRSL